MAEYVLSALADEDLVNIYTYSYQLFGRAQAETYTRDIYGRFALLANFPGMGLPVKLGKTTCLKFPTGSHAVYYRRTNEGIFIGRILAVSQDPTRHEFGD
jgi:toxin ParE1/3/4